MNKSAILLTSIDTFYNIPENRATLLEILNKTGGISLRNLEWFITNYSKKNNLTYKTGDGKEHPSIGRIKQCALLNLNTTYGNGNTYMTYDDPDRTMTQYKIDLTFQELEPITEDDYLEVDERSERVSQGVPIGPLQGSQDFSDRGGIGF